LGFLSGFLTARLPQAAPHLGSFTTRTRLTCNDAPMRAGKGCVSLLVMGVLVVTGCSSTSAESDQTDFIYKEYCERDDGGIYFSNAGGTPYCEQESGNKVPKKRITILLQEALREALPGETCDDDSQGVAGEGFDANGYMSDECMISLWNRLPSS